MQAHEPIFGVGPHTLFKGGIGAEVELEIERDKLENVYELAYGVTSDLTVTGQLPLVFVSPRKDLSLGSGDASLRFKWRFLGKDLPGATHQIAAVGGLRLPTGSIRSLQNGPKPLAGILGALTYGYESRRWYWWTDGRYALTSTTESIRLGHRLLYDAAFGVRPFLLTYDEPDLVVLLELNGQQSWSKSQNPTKLSGEHLIRLGPGFMLSYRNFMLKGGIALPIYDNAQQKDEGRKWVALIGLEGHF